MSRKIKRYRRTRKRRPGNLKWLMPILTFILVIASLYYFMQSAFFNVTSIEVLGAKGINGEEIIKLSGLVKGENIFKLDTSKAHESIGINSLVDDVQINRKLPNKVLIHIKERIPVAMMPVDEGFIQFDIKGYALKNESELGNDYLPIITGVDVPSGLAMGDRLDDRNFQIGLQLVGQMDQEIKELVSEIDVTNPQKLRAFLVKGAEVRLGDANDVSRKFAKAMQVLKEQKKINKVYDILYIDVSYSDKPVIYYRN